MPDLRIVAREYRENIAKKSFEELVLLPPKGAKNRSFAMGTIFQ
ncbi:MAG: hypothetical protein U0173_12735 [Nitrospiraceae bacterium]